MARNSADVTSELDHGTSSPSSSTAASDRSPKDTTKPTKNRSMARSKPLSRKSSAAAIPADSHIDVVSSEDEIADADADDVEDELAEEGDSEIVEVTAPATKKPGMAKPSALPRASASRGQPTSTKPPTPQEQPAPPQARKSALKPAAKPGPDDGAAAAPKPVLKAAAPQATREEKRLRGEIEDLRAENEQLDALIDKVYLQFPFLGLIAHRALVQSNAIAKSFEEKYEALLRSREVGPDPNLQARNMELEKRVEGETPPCSWTYRLLTTCASPNRPNRGATKNPGGCTTLHFRRRHHTIHYERSCTKGGTEGTEGHRERACAGEESQQGVGRTSYSA